MSLVTYFLKSYENNLGDLSMKLNAILSALCSKHRTTHPTNPDKLSAVHSTWNATRIKSRSTLQVHENSTKAKQSGTISTSSTPHS